MDPKRFNRKAWDNIATSRHRWFEPADVGQIEAARRGEVAIRLTATKRIPETWLSEIGGADVLVLAGGGGHQGPILAAAGAEVTVVDFSAAQLEIDRRVASEHGLRLQTVRSDMADLRGLSASSFDFVINPCSVNFVPEVRPVWREAARVLRGGGTLMAGFIQPVNYLFDEIARDHGRLVVRHRIPYSDLDLDPERREQTIGPERPIEFGHSLDDLIGGQLDAGLHLVDIMEDRWGGKDALSDSTAVFMVTRAIKPS